jgi:hypothetical protein
MCRHTKFEGQASMTPALTALAQDFETILGGAIRNAFNKEGKFYIYFREGAEMMLNEATKNIGMSLFAMNYTKNEICITMQFSDYLTETCGNNLFHYCQFSLSNDGAFACQIDDATLKKGINLSLTTAYDQPLVSKATKAEIDAATNALQIAFQTRLLTA